MDENLNPTLSETETRDKMDLQWRTGSPGYWVPYLLPLALLLNPTQQAPVSKETLSILPIIVFNTTILTAFHWLELNIYQTIEKVKRLCALLTVVSLIWFYNVGGKIVGEYVPLVFLNFTYMFIFRKAIKNYPKSFTFGEGLLVTSTFVYFMYIASQNIPYPPNNFDYLAESSVVILFVQMGFLGTIIIARGIIVFVKQYKWYGLEELYVIWAKTIFGAFAYRLQNGPADVWFLVYWIPEFLIGNSYRRTILIQWTMLLGAAYLFVIYINVQGISTASWHRKVFHILIVAVYVPVVDTDISLLYFCSAVVLFAFIIIEALRVLKFEYYEIKFGEKINTLVEGFRDHQDEGKLILTPIYLLCGISLPIWLIGLYSEHGKVIMSPESIAACLTGVLSIGIGDSFASIGGKLFGRHKIRGSEKTFEGMVSSIGAQLITVGGLYFCRFIPFTYLSCTALIISTLANACAESVTDQIDNLVVPLTAYNVFNLVVFLRDFIPFL